MCTCLVAEYLLQILVNGFYEKKFTIVITNFLWYVFTVLAMYAITELGVTASSALF